MSHTRAKRVRPYTPAARNNARTRSERITAEIAEIAENFLIAQT